MADIMLSELNGDLKISNGDFVIGDTTNQEVADILISNPGEWHQFPDVGCALINYQDGIPNGLQSLVKKQLIGDGLTINNLKISIDANGELNIEAACTR